MSKEDIIKAFKVGCEDCLFKKECDDMYYRIRKSTTNTFCLCDVIAGDVN